jgi:hypothetical protein
MNSLAIFLSLTTLFIMAVNADEGHDSALKKAPIIKHSVDDEGIHHYDIPIAYRDADARSIGYITENNKNVLKVEHLTKKDGFRFSTRKELTGGELMEIYHNRAWGMGDVPNWVELVLLSKAKSKEFPSGDYQVTLVAKADIEKTLKRHKVAISDFTPIKRNCFDLELPMTEKADRMLVVNSRAAKCMGHDNYSLRIINKEGEVMWQDLEALGGDLQFLRINIDEDAVKEILFHQDDHGEESLVIVDPKR